MNMIWKVEAQGSSLSRLVRARAVSLGLVTALGFMLLVSLVASAAISALGNLINAQLPFGTLVLAVINAIVSFVLLAAIFAAIFKILPDRTLEWRDVWIGAVVTAALFTLGKSLIGWYIGSRAVAAWIWGRRWAARHPAVGLLLGGNFSFWCGNHSRLFHSTRQQVRSGRCASQCLTCNIRH
ncbi:hypothetical protein X767_04615 [Mesorhizobium sp. LSJC264A00]|nr:hypothetical protein X767_04615 [Mesorhizobium sp. LSJC264A00]